MDHLRLSGYSRLSFSSHTSKRDNSDFELSSLGTPATPKTRETSPNSALLTSHVPGSAERAQRLNTHWDPFFLRRWTLIEFAVFFAAVIAALQVVYSVSQSNHGIATSNDKDHYLWTYGPTAVFVVVTVLWRHVDYAAKSIQPWANMARGPQPAKNSLLLDYVTPLQLLSLWRSLKSGHSTVSTSIVVFVLIKVITVLSTGMFSLETVQRSGIPITMAPNNTFDGRNLQDAAAVDSRAAFVAYGHKAYNIVSTPDPPQPVAILSATFRCRGSFVCILVAPALDLLVRMLTAPQSLPIGTSDEFAVQSFAPNNGLINGSLTYSAAVDVFSAHLSCESGKIKSTTAFDEIGSNAPVAAYYNTTVTLPDCQIYGAYVSNLPTWH